MMETKVVGQSLPRLDAQDKVTGQARYSGDYSMPGMLHAKVVWSEHPHAWVRRIDTSQAEAYPGVVRVITAADVPVNEYGINSPDQPVLVAAGRQGALDGRPDGPGGGRDRAGRRGRPPRW